MRILPFIILTIGITPAGGETKSPEPNPIPITATEKTESESVWAMESQERWERIYPSNWGQTGIFRVRSAESLPPKTLTFGIGGEFYSTSSALDLGGSTSAKTIAENLFAGYSFTDRMTIGIVRRNSSTTFGEPQQLISSLGDFNVSGMYQFPLTSLAALSPIINILVASDFNELKPSGNTLSAGGGVAFSILFQRALGVPVSAHANLLYHLPQIRDNELQAVSSDAYFSFSRYHTLTTAIGSELHFGDFMPFIEYHHSAQLGSPVSWTDSPSRFSVGARFTPLENKSLAFLLGADIGVGRGLAAGVPYTPPYQIIGQLSYTVGLASTQRKHYYTTKDIGVVDRKFVIGKNINFKVGSAELESTSYELLDQIASIVRENKINKLLIVGHTDSTHTDDYNLKLSVDRAGSVKTYLVKQGIAEEILMTQGYGKRKPKASNLTEEGRALNRRVEFYILE